MGTELIHLSADDRYINSKDSVQYGEKVRRLLELIDQRFLLKGGVLLDIGCGTGWALFHLRKRFKRLFGNDVSVEAIKRARRRVPEATFIIGDCVRIPLPRANVTLLLDVLEHLERREAEVLLKHIYERLTFVDTIVVATPTSNAYLNISPSLPKMSPFKHKFVWGKFELARFLKQCGFTIRTMLEYASGKTLYIASKFK